MIILNQHLISFQKFPNNERRLDINTDFLSTTKNVISWRYDSDEDIWQLFMFLDTFNRLVDIDAENHLVIQYMPYSRMDRVEASNTAFSLSIFTNLLTQYTRDMTIHVFDPHSPKTLELLNSQRESQAKELDVSLKDKVLKSFDLSSTWVVFPDKGAQIRYGEDLDRYPNVIVCEKVRDFATGKIQSIEAQVVKRENEHVSKLVMIDDLCSYGGTFIGCLEAIKKQMPITHASLIVSHAEPAIYKGQIFENFDQVYTTTSIKRDKDLTNLKIIETSLQTNIDNII